MKKSLLIKTWLMQHTFWVFVLALPLLSLSAFSSCSQAEDKKEIVPATVDSIVYMVSAVSDSISDVPARDTIHHIDVARRYVGWIEKRGNRGSVADSANRYVGVPLGSSYCHTWVLWTLNQSNATTKLPKNGMAQSARTKQSFSALSVIYGNNHVRRGDVITWAKYNRSKKNTGFGHSGFASDDWDKTSGMSIQANTSGNRENRDGEGIYEKEARISPNSLFRIIRFTPIEY